MIDKTYHCTICGRHSDYCECDSSSDVEENDYRYNIYWSEE